MYRQAHVACFSHFGRNDRLGVKRVGIRCAKSKCHRCFSHWFVRNRRRVAEESSHSCVVHVFPSTSLTVYPATTRSPSGARAFGKRLNGDLDTLALTALSSEPSRRYPSAEALLDDLRRWKNDLPLEAQPETTLYRLKKFAVRHKWGVSVSAAALVALVCFAGILLIQQRRTTQALHESEATASFPESLFSAADPYADERLDTLRAADLLARGAERARAEFPDQHALRSRMHTLIGETYIQLNLLDEAQELLEEALQTRLALFGEGHEAVAETRHALGAIAQFQGRYEEVERHLLSAITTYRERLGVEDESTLAAIKDLAYLYEDVSRYDEAEELLRELVSIRREINGEASIQLANVLQPLTLVLRGQERFEEAEPLTRQAIQIQQSYYGEDHPNTAATLFDLGAILRAKGDFVQAEETYRRALDINRSTLGEHHRQTEIGRTHLAELLREKGEFEESALLYSEVLERTRISAGADHPGVGIITALLAGVYTEAQEYVRAENTNREALRVMEAALPPGHVRIARASVGLGEALAAQQRFAEAEAELVRAYHLFADNGHNPERATEQLIALYESWQKPDEAARWRAVSGMD